MRVVACLQARLGSERLPGKVVREINGLPLIVHIWRRLLACEEVDQVAVAWGGKADAVPSVLNEWAMFCAPWWPEEDLLRRHLQAGYQYHADAIVRVTADCLFHDPALIDQLVRSFKNDWPRSRGVSNWPYRRHSEGVDAEVWSMELLAELDRTKECPREGFAAWVCNDPTRSVYYLMTLGMQGEKNDGEPHLSIDTPEDLALAEKMLAILGKDRFDYAATMEAYNSVMAEE